jgi:hypothetical protein
MYLFLSSKKYGRIYSPLGSAALGSAALAERGIPTPASTD